MAERQYLRKAEEGSTVFALTEILAARNDMFLCDIDGNLQTAAGQMALQAKAEAEAKAEAAKEAETKEEVKVEEPKKGLETAPSNLEALRAEAKELGIKGWNNMKEPKLIERIAAAKA